MALLLAVPALVVLAPASQAATSPVTMMVIGETHGTKQVTHDLVNVAKGKGATGCVCPGDFIYGHWDTTPQAWRDMMAPMMGRMIPAQGNHDWPWGDWKSMFPGGQSYFSIDVNGVQIISVNTEYSLASGSTQRAWLERTLQERPDGDLKIVMVHRPWWLPGGAVHPSSEFQSKQGTSPSTMDRLMQEHGVDFVVAAHEKNYQHSKVNGIHYLVAGAGGPDSYSMGYSLPGAIKRLTSKTVTVMDVTPTQLTMKSYDRYGGKVDEWTIVASSSSGGSTGDSTSSTFSASFQPHGGNQWWVQTKVDSSATVAKVEARVDGGSWKPLSLRSWGSWAASMSVPEGSKVEFRATSSGGSVATSGAYLWPDGTPTSGSGSTGSTFSATFRPHGGNAWWVQTKVDSSATLAKVEARVDGGSWKPLSLRSWGSWAASMSAPEGSKVEFRATGITGATSTSGAYAWPQATPASGSAGGSTFSASFQPHDGNAWWVQTKVSSSTSIAKMEARVDGGSWKPLSLRSWGSWAASMSAPEGSKVEFRATSSTGATATSASYSWPAP